MICLIPRTRLHLIGFGLLVIGRHCFAQGETERTFYELYPELRTQKDIVQLAYDRMKQDGFQAKTLASANRAVAINAYLLLNRSSGVKIPYWQVLEMYNEAQELPEFKDTHMSLPDYAVLMNNGTGSSAFDEGLNDSWLRRVGVRIPSFSHEGWNIVILEVLAGLILLVIIFRATSRSPRTGVQQDQLPIVRESVWKRAMRPASIAAKWASLCGILSVFRVEHVSLFARIGFALVFGVALALVIALPVYLIAVLSLRNRDESRGMTEHL